MTETTTKPAPKTGQWIRQAVDFGALLAFAAAYFITRDMIKATWVLVIASALALATGFLVEKRFAPLPLITGLFALVFGGRHSRDRSGLAGADPALRPVFRDHRGDQ